MVSNTLNYNNVETKKWRPVARPVPNQGNLGFSKLPPTVASKPGGKVYVYVYEEPGANPGSYQRVTSSGRLPANAQLIVGQPEPVPYPHANENKPQVTNGRQTPEVRIRERSKKSGKGYKLLADVMPRKELRSSSKGGRMFVKQKNRMEEFTTSVAPVKKTHVEQRPTMDVEERATPWNIAKVSSQGVHYTPAKYYNSSLYRNVSKIRGKELLALRPEPPPAWRAKVEANYELDNGYQTLPQQRRWNVEDAMTSQKSRCDSAPPPADDNLMDEASTMDHNGESAQDSWINRRPQSQNMTSFPTASINFNAKQHLGAPHRRQGIKAGRSVFVTTPNVQLDFNATPVGWSKSYQY